MDREIDLTWFLENCERLSKEHPGRWLVVYRGTLQKAFSTEEEAVTFSITEFGLEEASIFQAIPSDLEREGVWVLAARRRLAELRSGVVRPIAGNEVLGRILDRRARP